MERGSLEMRTTREECTLRVWTTILIGANGNCRWWQSPPCPSFPSPFLCWLNGVRTDFYVTTQLDQQRKWSEGKGDRHQPQSIFKNLSNLATAASSSSCSTIGKTWRQCRAFWWKLDVPIGWNICCCNEQRFYSIFYHPLPLDWGGRGRILAAWFMLSNKK